MTEPFYPQRYTHPEAVLRQRIKGEPVTCGTCRHLNPDWGLSADRFFCHKVGYDPYPHNDDVDTQACARYEDKTP